MSWRDAAALAVKNLRRRFGHSILTVLAVALAATLLTALRAGIVTPTDLS